MSSVRNILIAATMLICCLGAKAQTADYDVFVPIGKYLSQGNSDALSAWFSDNLEMSVLSKGGNSSRNQRQDNQRNRKTEIFRKHAVERHKYPHNGDWQYIPH